MGNETNKKEPFVKNIRLSEKDKNMLENHMHIKLYGAENDKPQREKGNKTRKDHYEA